jgi:hypothetical protein
MKSIIYLSFLVIFLSTEVALGRHREMYYQERFCKTNSGRMEVSMSDGTRCDCVTETHSIEVEFAAKWYEAIGQSLNYARQTGRRAGIVVIYEEGPRDARRLKSLMETITFHQLPIDVWRVRGRQ